MWSCTYRHQTAATSGGTEGFSEMKRDQEKLQPLRSPSASAEEERGRRKAAAQSAKRGKRFSAPRRQEEKQQLLLLDTNYSLLHTPTSLTAAIIQLLEYLDLLTDPDVNTWKQQLKLRAKTEHIFFFQLF